MVMMVMSTSIPRCVIDAQSRVAGSRLRTAESGTELEGLCRTQCRVAPPSEQSQRSVCRVSGEVPTYY
jgi:hypothetical protein